MATPSEIANHLEITAALCQRNGVKYDALIRSLKRGAGCIRTLLDERENLLALVEKLEAAAETEAQALIDFKQGNDQ